MKRMLIALVLTSNMYSMQNTEPTIIKELTDIVVQLDSTLTTDDATYKQLITAYLKHESDLVEESITPHLKSRLRDSDEEIKDLLAKDDPTKLQDFISSLVSKSIEDAMADQKDQFEELKKLSEEKLAKAKMSLLIAVVTGVLGVVGTFVGAWFGHH